MKMLRLLVMVFAGCIAFAAMAADLDLSSPAIVALKQSMQARHGQLAPFYASGAIGVASNGGIAIRDANAIPLAQRQAANSLVVAENADRASLYREIARANGHPEWENEIRNMFSARWIERAQGGWWVQRPTGDWARK